MDSNGLSERTTAGGTTPPARRPLFGIWAVATASTPSVWPVIGIRLGCRWPDPIPAPSCRRRRRWSPGGRRAAPSRLSPPCRCVRWAAALWWAALRQVAARWSCSVPRSSSGPAQRPVL